MITFKSYKLKLTDTKLCLISEEPTIRERTIAPGLNLEIV